MTDKSSNDYCVVVCASGGGGNFQALIDAQSPVEKSAPCYRIIKLITDRDCGALDRAEKSGIEALSLDKKILGAEAFWSRFDYAIPDETDLIVLAGFIPIIPPNICEKWKGRMINTHPSLLPKHGGKGMVGVKVQEAVIAAGDDMAGCTVHYVSPEIDGGQIILQAKIPVRAGESAWDLGGRVFKEENRILVEAVLKLKEGQRLNGKVD